MDQKQKWQGKLRSKYLLNWWFFRQVHWTHHISYLILSGSSQFFPPFYFCLTPFQSGPEPGSVYNQNRSAFILTREKYERTTSGLCPLGLCLCCSLSLNYFLHPGTLSSRNLQWFFTGSELTPNFSVRHFTTLYHSNNHAVYTHAVHAYTG